MNLVLTELSFHARMARLKRDLLLEYLNANDWNITQSAKAAMVRRTDFHALMKRHGIKNTEGDRHRNGHRGTWGELA